MKLNIKKRSAEKQSDVNSLRREGFIPAVFYSKSKPTENVAVAKSEFDAFLRQLKQGRLATTKLTLSQEGQPDRKAIVKDIQYNITTYDVIHLDFEELVEGTKVRVNVPIECVGAENSAGVKLGGVVRQVIRNLRIECLPKDLPEDFKLDVSSLGMRESKRLSDIALKDGLRPIADLNEVAAVIVKR